MNTFQLTLEQLEYAWNNYQVYLNDEINFIDEDDMFNPASIKRNRMNE